MNARRLLALLVIIVPVLVWVSPATAVTISFLEPTSDTGNIGVSTDIAGATIATGPELASVSVGNVHCCTGIVPVITALIGPGQEGGGQGVSDIVSLIQFLDLAGNVIGFVATFQSDSSISETGIPRAGLVFTTPDIIETGLPQTVFSGPFVLPGGTVDLVVIAQSDRDVPEPSTLLLLGSGLLGLAGTVIWRARRRN